MEPERWRRVEQLYHTARERPESQRAAYLSESCSDDEALRREVESLLAREGQAEQFMEVPALEVLAQGMTEDLTQATQSGEEERHLVGRTISHYRVLSKVGGGGMGTVYLAVRDDEQYKKHAAIKVIKRGMDTDAILRRFRQERQIIANLDHPNIARLLDGGTTEDGLPYFVMEYIEGEPIDEFCDSHKLPIPDRLVLFRSVCSAVQYAHQNLVIHRDIKPSNILVTKDGVPKLLDFGIAKLLNPDSGGTIEVSLTVQHLMTPDYASPEQVRGNPVTTASDIYSLGVLLYILLSGHRPYRLKTLLLHEVVHVICETEPEKPSAAVTRIEQSTNLGQAVRLTPKSVTEARGEVKPGTLCSHLAGDLDNIVLKAMHKEAKRRYASAAQFSEDVGRHLAGLPVIAHPDTPAYRAAKFVRRNRASVAAGAAILFVLCAGIVVSTWEAHVARLERAKAERRYHDTRAIADSLILDMPAAIERGPTKARAMLAERAVTYLTKLATDSPGDADLQFDLAKSYVMLGQAHNQPGYSNLGDLSGALQSYQQAVSILQSLLASRPADKQVRFYLARTYNDVALTVMETDVTRSLEMHRRALATLPASDARDLELQMEIYNASQLLGERYGHPYYSNCGDTQHALEYIGRAFQTVTEIVRITSDNSPSNPFYHRLVGLSQGYRVNLAVSYNRMAGLLWATGDTVKALAYENKGIELLKSTTADPNNRALLQGDLGVRFIRLANLLEEDGQYREALRKTEEASGIFEPYSRRDQENVAYRRALAVNYNRKGSVLVKIGRPEEALNAFRRATTFSLELSGAMPQDPETRDRLADSFEGIGNVTAGIGRLQEARSSCNKALELREGLFKLDPHNARYRSHLGVNYISFGDILVKQRKWSEALDSYEKALAILDAMSTDDPLNWLLLRARADAYSKAGDAEGALASSLRAGDRNRRDHILAARSWYKRSLALWNDMKAKSTLDRPHARTPAQITRKIAAVSAAP